MRTYKRSTTIGKIKIIELTDKERLQLEESFRLGKSHSFRMRCRAILLKSNGLTSKEVSIQTEMTHISVNSWVKRVECEGVTGLDTRLGRGRKPDIIDSSDEESVRRTIENDRQQASGKKASESTFRAFLSALARDIDV